MNKQNNLNPVLIISRSWWKYCLCIPKLWLTNTIITKKYAK